MRLIHTRTFDLEEFLDTKVPKYAILSHTWGDKEVTFDIYRSEFVRDEASANGAIHGPGGAKNAAKKEQRPKGDYSKIRSACLLAASKGYDWIWIDTCCIDKKSSAELQEAINRMYRYYESAAVCYVYLSDMPTGCPELRDPKRAPAYGNRDDDDGEWIVKFKTARWFLRGWTLQELIAPRGAVDFYNSKWKFIGSKKLLIHTISAVTNIPPAILRHDANVDSMSVARRMSWASRRQTSRIEDQAYSLLGLFRVNLPMLYGEGSKAFIRLQEEIIKTSTDHSIFTWEFHSTDYPDGTLLAPSPRHFEQCWNVVHIGRPSEFQMTNRGLRITLRTQQVFSDYEETIAVLNCRYINDFSGVLALRLRRYNEGDEFYAMKGDFPRPVIFPGHVAARNAAEGFVRRSASSRLAFVPESVLARLMKAASGTDMVITRQYETEVSRMKFWLPPARGEYKIIQAHPRALWDMNEGVMEIDSKDGHLFHVVFGFDHLPAAEETEAEENLEGVDESDHSIPNHLRRAVTSLSARAAARANPTHPPFLVGVWAWNRYSEDGLPGPDLRPVRHQHGLPIRDTDGSFNYASTYCNHKEPRCRARRCPKMSDSATVITASREAKLEVRVEVVKILQDTVFVVHVAVRPLFEMDENPPAPEEVAPAMSPVDLGWARMYSAAIRSFDDDMEM